MKILLLLATFVSSSNSIVSIYLLNLDSGEALTSHGDKVQFSKVSFGDLSQLWQFTSNGSIIVRQDDKYLGFNNLTKNLELKQTADMTWFWRDMKIQVSDQNPSQELCLGAAMQVVSCDTATKIIAQVHEEELYSKIKGMNTSLKTTVEQLTANLTKVVEVAEVIEEEQNTTHNSVLSWNTDLPKHIADFRKHAGSVADNITLTKTHLLEKLQQFQGISGVTNTTVLEIKAQLDSIDVNFSILEDGLEDFKSKTNISIREKLAGLKEQLGTKSSNGHLAPDNMFEFAVLFLLSLGLVNVLDIARRLILYSINQRTSPKYGSE